MKVFKYWVTEKQNILIDGTQQEITCYGGSNVSVEDASVKAKEKARKIERKIAGDKRVFEDYEAEIREEILQNIDTQTVITRNRYGAQVLNTENLMILDIDKPKETKGGLGGLFKKKDPRPPKEQIFEMVRAQAANYGRYTFRIYETYQGARVIVLGRDFDPREDETQQMMEEFNCDPLYARLCRKQGCFRARLTPKPSRMKFRSFKVKYPREGDEGDFQRWVSDYESMSRSFSVCKLIDQVRTSQSLNEVVQLHDDITGVGYPQPLA